MIETIEYQLHDLFSYVNWIYFFHSWGLPSSFSSVAKVHDCPACQHAWVESVPVEKKGRAVEALKLYKNAVEMLRQLDGKFHVRTRFGLFPAWSEVDDVVVCLSEKEDGIGHNCGCINKNRKNYSLHFLRQQDVQKGNNCLCLSDFIIPKTVREKKESGLPFSAKENNRGYALGVFVAAVDSAMESLYEDDSYRKMLLQTLCDRLAEAAAEKMHEEVRRKYWGYAPDEKLTPDELFSEKYEGRRPAVGYPSIPDQSFNFDIDKLIDMSSIGVHLTDNGMMIPHASVSGLMFDHPALRHFSVGTIGEDQLEDYAKRKGCDVNYCRKFLAANLCKNK